MDNCKTKLPENHEFTIKINNFTITKVNFRVMKEPNHNNKT